MKLTDFPKGTKIRLNGWVNNSYIVYNGHTFVDNYGSPYNIGPIAFHEDFEPYVEYPSIIDDLNMVKRDLNKLADPQVKDLVFTMNVVINKLIEISDKLDACEDKWGYQASELEKKP
jgi:hypothetical protein